MYELHELIGTNCSNWFELHEFLFVTLCVIQTNPCN